MFAIRFCRSNRCRAACLFTLLVGTAIGRAGTTSFSGAADVSLQEFIGGSPGSSASDSKTFPGTSASLPIQVVSALRTGEGEFPSAAAVAAQFADPTTAAGSNPEEFAINLTLNSVDPSVRYEATARSQEKREILFSPGEVARGTENGDEIALTGRVFIDGALTIIAVNSGQDLSGAFVRLNMTVVKSVSSQSDEQVYFGQVELNGQTDGQVVVGSDGDFPTARLILTDLSVINSDFSAFRVLIIPRIDVDFEYSAIVGEPFTLTATVTVNAGNVPDNVGVAAVIGTPTDSLTDVIGFTNGTESAAKLVDQIRSERDDPSGELAFPDAAAATPFCALFGLEGLLAIAGIIGLKRRTRR